jgi:hypothetical protein
MQPTTITAAEFQLAYDHFNARLFDAQLPQCLITLQRSLSCMGYFSYQRFVSAQGMTDEIAMNPEFFANNPIQETLQTLVHEMTHLWQYHFGKPSRRTYHNAQWANKMESFGLMPSSTGAPGGARTGQHMADYALPGGRFLAECERLLQSNFRISFGDRIAKTVVRPALEVQTETTSIALVVAPIRSPHIVAHVPHKTSRVDRVKFTCVACELNAWAKPSANLVCGDCGDALACVE